jgi:hypothetical protein
MDINSIASNCGPELWSDLKRIWKFLTDAEGQLALLGLAYLRKLLRSLIRSSVREARELGILLLTLLLLCSWIAVRDFGVPPNRSIIACVPSNHVAGY